MPTIQRRRVEAHHRDPGGERPEPAEHREQRHVHAVHAHVERRPVPGLLAARPRRRRAACASGCAPAASAAPISETCAIVNDSIAPNAYSVAEEVGLPGDHHDARDRAEHADRDRRRAEPRADPAQPVGQLLVLAHRVGQPAHAEDARRSTRSRGSSRPGRRRSTPPPSGRRRGSCSRRCRGSGRRRRWWRARSCSRRRPSR